MLGGRGTVANFWHTEVQKNNVQELSMRVICEGVYHPGVQEGELKKDTTVLHTGSVPQDK